MRWFLVLGMLAASAPGVLQASISLDEYRQRRAALRKALPNSVILLAGATEPEKGGLRTGFIQEPNFLYLSGWREPGAWMLLTPDKDVLFLPPRSDRRERYTGPKLAPGDAGAESTTGFAEVVSEPDLDARLRAAAPAKSTLHALPGTAAERVKQALEGRTADDATLAIARLRMVKSAAEIALIRRATDASVDAHRAAWRRAAPGIREYQVAATTTATYSELGCERHAYMPIVASGPNAIVLHYGANRRRMDAGDLMLMDAGAECSDYAADLTRTIPVSGKFNARQREIYDIVLGAQRAAIAAAKPGMRLLGTGDNSLNGIALAHVNQFKDARGEPMGKYYLHSLGHHVGLEVHDATDPDVELKAGMVITIEPGIYIAEEGIGVRIEDMVLITESGAEVLSRALPTDPAAVEKAVRRK